GLTFKENCPDTRNTKIVDIINELKEYGVQSFVTDAYAENDDAKKEYGIDLVPMNELKNMDAVIVAVAHDKYFELTQADIDAIYAPCDNTEKVLIDVKGILDRKAYEAAGYCYWRL
ncbi:MAG: nucleotide sugar dehydrogenase, partial [Clostridia bacterium]|nr:nucleotide sugar dehydrogenase [Clostridia bacterium]